MLSFEQLKKSYVLFRGVFPFRFSVSTLSHGLTKTSWAHVLVLVSLCSQESMPVYAYFMGIFDAMEGVEMDHSLPLFLGSIK